MAYKSRCGPSNAKRAVNNSSAAIAPAHELQQSGPIKREQAIAIVAAAVEEAVASAAGKVQVDLKNPEV